MRQVREPAVLSRPEFDSAVRDALRALRRPDALAASPLSRSRLVLQNGGDLEEVQHELSGTPLPARESTAL
ncbi:hypothetical protein [Streptomyces exfoliatus]|uniref:hypothetical protein n=1 Tax=Streptomyces exfoliatus TaxID=1905 RepID=UPI0004CC53C5|nr:hypothetical protein [Streptomyces exfoliatus]